MTSGLLDLALLLLLLLLRPAPLPLLLSAVDPTEAICLASHISVAAAAAAITAEAVVGPAGGT